MTFKVSKDGWIEGAVRVPVPPKGRDRLEVVNRVSAHIAVSNAQSLKTSFDENGEVDSHLYVRHGTRSQIRDPEGMADFEQYVPLTHNAYADLDGNDGSWSIESAGGMGSDAVVGEWDAAQVRRFIWLWRGLRKHGNIPNKLATSSRLNSMESKGLSWHRLGIDGNFPMGELGGRLQRGADSVDDPHYMHYSKSWGKGCPTPLRIRQLKTIHARSNMDIDFPTTPTPPPVEKRRKPERLKTIQYGSRGEEVVLWQRFLKGTGYRNIEIDGIFGDDTRKTTEWWQTAVMLTRDGVVGAYTWTEAITDSGRLNKGDHSIPVGIWQVVVGVTVDYDFGPRTDVATEEVQRYLNVDDDGVVWEDTVNALRNWWI